MANAHLPPVPPAGQAKHPGATKPDPKGAGAADAHSTRGEAPQQGKSGNLQQNTTHQGHQQDR